MAPATSSASVPDQFVVDASAVVDLLLGNDVGIRVEFRLRGHELHAPAHLDAEALSALGRLHRAGELDEEQVSERLDALATAAIERHPLSNLLAGAWTRRHTLRLVDALYVDLAEQIDATLLTTDGALAAATDVAELIENP
jgi:predicted nucleic acid-binding protein